MRRARRESGETRSQQEKSSGIPTRREDTSTKARHVGVSQTSPSFAHPSETCSVSLGPSSFPRFFIVLSCRDLPYEKPPLDVSLMRQPGTHRAVPPFASLCVLARSLFSLLTRTKRFTSRFLSLSLFREELCNLRVRREREFRS